MRHLLTKLDSTGSFAEKHKHKKQLTSLWDQKINEKLLKIPLSDNTMKCRLDDLTINIRCRNRATTIIVFGKTFRYCTMFSIVSFRKTYFATQQVM